MDDPTLPSSLIGAITFFLLLGITAFVVIKETVKVILKPALVVVVLAIVAVWVGVLDQTVVGHGFAWIGDYLLAGVRGISQWVADSWAGPSGEG
jgi:hypothetical protein